MMIECASANAGQVREMVLGINSFKFHYLHVLIVLLKGDESSSSVRMLCAREALSLLPSMVSNWSSVYNEMVWYEYSAHPRSLIRYLSYHFLRLCLSLGQTTNAADIGSFSITLSSHFSWCLKISSTAKPPKRR